MSQKEILKFIEENTLTIKARDIIPYKHGFACTLPGSSDVVIVDFVLKKWNKNKTRFQFLLDTHNILSFDPSDKVNVVDISDDLNKNLIKQAEIDNKNLLEEKLCIFS